MSDHYSIYCESISCSLYQLTKKLMNKELTDDEFMSLIEGYKVTCSIYLTSLKVKALHMCCQGHLSIHKEEISDVEHLLSILSNDYETFKSNSIDIINMDAMANKDVMNNTNDKIH